MTGLLLRVWRPWRLLGAVLYGDLLKHQLSHATMEESCWKKILNNLSKNIDDATFFLTMSCLSSFEGFWFVCCYFHVLAVDTFISPCCLHWTRGSSSPLQIVFGSHQCVTCSQDLIPKGFPWLSESLNCNLRVVDFS